MTQPHPKRLKVVLYNPRAVFFTMPLALLAIGSELDPEVSRGKRLLQQLARYRCDKDNYRWPVEMLFTRWLVPAQTLS
jgi:hypothetical protein